MVWLLVVVVDEFVGTTDDEFVWKLDDDNINWALG